MPKFSIIIPVYNVEKYIGKCLDSVMNQSFKNYEIIVVNDGTKDNSMDIVKNYPVKIITQKNQGLSEARNIGVRKAKGDYIIFLDSDDYIEKDLLKKINKSLDNNPDIVRYQIQEVDEKDKILNKYEEKKFENLSGVDAFKEITKYHFVENAWCYAIKREYYQKEKFEFKKGTIHEDFGLIPLVIIKAKKVNSISYIGYNYLQRQGSIMSSNDYEKTKKKVEDFYNHYLYLEEEINKTKLDSKYFKSFISNSLILKINELNQEDYKIYLKRLKKDKVFNNLLSDTLPRKIKKLIIKINPKLYFNKKK
jgi:glycosyltransferase involved in cell wall biosynthesis